MRKFLNDPKKFVTEFLEGVALASDGKLKFEPKYNLIYRADMPKPDRVSIIQGSGSGHEPAHTMIVGPGMLDAACPGDVFAGPPVEFVTETTKLMNTPAGVLYIVKQLHGRPHRVGDGEGADGGRGLQVGYLLVNDDVAVKDSTWTIGRRGVAGNFFVIKAAAAKADKGGSLEECVRVGEKAIANVRTMGVALSSCTPPVRGTTLFEISDGDGGRHRHPRGAGPRAASDRDRDRDRGPAAGRHRA
jgi:dihydroxyacetone kinase-like protein